MVLAAGPIPNWHTIPGTLLAALGGFALYVASRACADALAGGDPERPLRRAIGHCLPILVVALMCLRPSMGRPGIDPPGVGQAGVAVGIVFSTSVACVTLLLGIVTLLAPVFTLPPERKVWPFVLPAALLALVAGFNGRLTVLHAGMLALLGLAVGNLWWGIRAETLTLQTPDTSSESSAVRRVRVLTWARWIQLALAMALTFVGAWALSRGVVRLEQSSRLLTGTLLAGTVLGPLLTLPVLGSTSRLAETGHSASAVTTLISIVLVNLCAVLPILIVAHYVISAASAHLEMLRLGEVLREHARPAPFPIVSWRVDTVVLVVIGFALVPWSMARWTFTRLESIGLIVAYAAFLGLVAFLSTK
jgi:Ca2+/Na+ antiporter